jgi:hypothetical protein
MTVLLQEGYAHERQRLDFFSPINLTRPGKH